MRKKTVMTGILAALAAMTLLTACGKKEETSLPDNTGSNGEEVVTEEENVEAEAAEEAEEEDQVDGVDMNWFLNEDNYIKVSFNEVAEAGGGEVPDEDVYFYIPYLDGVTENKAKMSMKYQTLLEAGEEESALSVSIDWFQGDDGDLKKAYHTREGEYSTIEIGEKYVLQYPSKERGAKQLVLVNRNNLNVFVMSFVASGRGEEIRLEARDLFVEKMIQALEEQK